MYFDSLVNIPDVPGKIVPKRTTIGKQSAHDPSRMLPNQNYLRYFPDAEGRLREKQLIFLP